MLSKLSPRSILMVLASAVFGRMSAALSQLISAVYLDPEDFGVYAAALSAVTLTTFMRGGGTGNFVPTMTPEELDQRGGAYFRYGLIFTGMGTLLTVLTSPIVLSWYAGNKAYPSYELSRCLLLAGLNFVLFNLCVFPRARFIAYNRFSELSAMDCITGGVRLGATWSLAYAGFGAVTLAASIVAGQLIEVIWCWTRSGFFSTAIQPQGPWLRQSLSDLKYPFLMALLISLNDRMDAVVTSMFVPATVLGLYYFASQLAAQPATLAGATVRALFTSATAKIRGDVSRESDSIRQAFSGAMVFIPLFSMLIPAIFYSLERVVWQGRWSAANLPIAVLSFTAIYPTVQQIVAAPIAGIRNWRLAILFDLSRALAKIVPAAIAGVFIMRSSTTSSFAVLALCLSIGGCSALVASFDLTRALCRAQMPRHTVLYELYSTPLAALLSALAASGLARSAAEPLLPVLGERGAAGVECVIAGSVYSMLAVILLRFGYTATLERLVAALPEFMRAPARRLFVL